MSTKPLFVNGWEVAGIRSAKDFFSALPQILSLPVNLCFEGTSISPDVQELFATNAVAPALQIPPGTIWPTPRRFHIRATQEFIRQLAVVAGRHAEPGICDHFHAYNDGHGLVQWYDAFDLPVLIEESIVEAKLQTFCSKLRVRYLPWWAL